MSITQIKPKEVIQIPEPPIARFLFADTRMAWLWLIVRLYVGYEWLTAGLDKLTGYSYTFDAFGQKTGSPWVFGAHDGQVKRRAGQLQIREKHRRGWTPVDYWNGRQITQGPLCYILVSLFAGVVEQNVGRPRQHSVFVALWQRTGGSHKTGSTRIAKVVVDKGYCSFGLGQPLAVGCGSIEREKCAGHRHVVPQIGSGRIVGPMTKAAIGQSSIGHYPARGLQGLFGKTVTTQGGETVTVDESYLRESILHPSAKVAAGYQPIMPTFQGVVSEEQLLQLIEYVKSLGPAATAR